MGVNAALYIAAAAAAGGIVQSRRSAAASKKASKASERRADIAANRDRREVVRKGRVRRAELIANASNTGAGGSSAELGSIGALQTQVGTNLGESFQAQDLSQQQSSFNRKATTASSNASIFNTVGSFAAGQIKP